MSKSLEFAAISDCDAPSTIYLFPSILISRSLAQAREQGNELSATFNVRGEPEGGYQPLAFAALWETWCDPESDAKVDSATIIVGAANDWMSRFHHRMPVILDWRNVGAWITGDDPSALLKSAPEDALQERIVSARVNRSGVGDDDADLIEQVAPLETA